MCGTSSALLSPHPAALLCPGGENGFNQAIELSAETLANVKFVQEKRLISRWGSAVLAVACCGLGGLLWAEVCAGHVGRLFWLHPASRCSSLLPLACNSALCPPPPSPSPAQLL